MKKINKANPDDVETRVASELINLEVSVCPSALCASVSSERRHQPCSGAWAGGGGRAAVAAAGMRALACGARGDGGHAALAWAYDGRMIEEGGSRSSKPRQALWRSA